MVGLDDINGSVILSHTFLSQVWCQRDWDKIPGSRSHRLFNFLSTFNTQSGSSELEEMCHTGSPLPPVNQTPLFQMKQMFFVESVSRARRH